MAWIESHGKLRRHPKVRRLEVAIHRSLPETIGWLHLLWWYAAEYFPSGTLGDLDLIDIERCIDWDGDPGELAKALVATGWLEVNPATGQLAVHDWGDYSGKHAVRRDRGRERVKASRGSLRQQVIDRDGYVCGICGGQVDPDDLHLDHIQPVSKGGKTIAENLRVSHAFCNVSRGNRDWRE